MKSVADNVVISVAVIVPVDDSVPILVIISVPDDVCIVDDGLLGREDISVDGGIVDVSTVVIESVLDIKLDKVVEGSCEVETSTVISVPVDIVSVFTNVIEDDSAIVLVIVVDGSLVDIEVVMVFILLDVEDMDEVMSVV